MIGYFFLLWVLFGNRSFQRCPGKRSQGNPIRPIRDLSASGLYKDLLGRLGSPPLGLALMAYLTSGDAEQQPKSQGPERAFESSGGLFRAIKA